MRPITRVGMCLRDLKIGPMHFSPEPSGGWIWLWIYLLTFYCIFTVCLHGKNSPCKHDGMHLQLLLCSSDTNSACDLDWDHCIMELGRWLLDSCAFHSQTITDWMSGGIFKKIHNRSRQSQEHFKVSTRYSYHVIWCLVYLHIYKTYNTQYLAVWKRFEREISMTDNAFCIANKKSSVRKSTVPFCQSEDMSLDPIWFWKDIRSKNPHIHSQQFPELLAPLTVELHFPHHSMVTTYTEIKAGVHSRI